MLSEKEASQKTLKFPLMDEQDNYPQTTRKALQEYIELVGKWRLGLVDELQKRIDEAQDKAIKERKDGFTIEADYHDGVADGLYNVLVLLCAKEAQK